MPCNCRPRKFTIHVRELVARRVAAIGGDPPKRRCGGEILPAHRDDDQNRVGRREREPRSQSVEKEVKDAAMDDFWESYRRAHEAAIANLSLPGSEDLPEESRKKFTESMGFAHLTHEEYTELRS